MTFQRSIMLASGAALVGVAAVMLWPVTPPESSLAPPEQRAAAPVPTPRAGAVLAPGTVGVGARDIDPARRAASSDPAVGTRGEVVALAPQRQPLTERPPERASAEPTPPQVLVPNAAAVAESEALAAVMPAAVRQVQAAIARQRAAMRQACWKGDGPDSATFAVEASFAADGGLLALSIGGNRDAPEVGACVRAQPLPLAIDAPGLPVTVQATISLP